MPIYEFECNSCKQVSEFLLRMDESKKKCPECGKMSLKRVISNISYHDTYSPMHPRKGRGRDGYGRVDPGEGMKDFGRNLG